MTIARNSVYSALGAGLPLLVTIITLPLLIGQIGLERYGVLAIAWLILVFAGQADFGLGYAITQRIAGGQDGAPPDIAVTGFVLALGAGLLTGLAGALLAYLFFAHGMALSPALQAEVLPAVWMIGAATLCVTLFGWAIGCLAGEERFGAVSLHTLVTNSALQLLPLAAAFLFAPDLGTLLGATLLARLAGLVLATLSVWRAMLRESGGSFSRAVAAKLLDFGRWIMLSTITRPVITMADRFLIGVQLGAVAVAAYSVPYQIASRTQLVPQAVIRVLFPRFSALSPEDALATARKAVVMLANISAPFMLVLICLADPLLRAWLGSELDERSILLARVLLAAFWLSGVSVLAATFIQARGEPRFTALWHLVQVPLFVGALYFVAPVWGLAGFALVFLLRTVIDAGVLMAKAGLATAPVLLRLAPPAFAIAAAMAAHSLLTGWQISLAAAAIGGAGSAVIAHFASPRDYRDRLYALLRLRRPVFSR